MGFASEVGFSCEGVSTSPGRGAIPRHPAGSRRISAEGWRAVADGVLVHRWANHDVNSTAVVGSSGVLVFDTLTSVPEARVVLLQLQDHVDVPVRHVVNSHVHYDHTFGNAAFAEGGPAPTFWAHPRCVESYDAAYADAERSLRASSSPDDPVDWPELLDRTVPRRPDREVSDETVVDLGDRSVILRHLGEGHTDGDLVAVVPDCGVVLAGDLVKESSPPTFWFDCRPVEWPATVRRLAESLATGARVVPGHGDLVEASFVLDFAARLQACVDESRRLYLEGFDLSTAAASGSWPWPRERLGQLLDRAWPVFADELAVDPSRYTRSRELPPTIVRNPSETTKGTS